MRPTRVSIGREITHVDTDGIITNVDSTIFSTSKPPRISRKLSKATASTIQLRRHIREAGTPTKINLIGVKINTQKFDTKDHTCTLPGEPLDVLTKFIETGILVALRRAIKRTTMIDSRHPYTKYYATSLNRQKQEEYRHLIWHYFTIHPLSMFSFCFDFFMCCVILLNAIVTPIVVMALRFQREVLKLVFIPMNCLYVLMIIMNFLLGFYDLKKNVVILDKKNIAWHYLRSYFIFDVLSLLPEFLRTDFADSLGINYNMKDASTGIKILAPTLILIAYTRCFWCLRVMQQIRLFYEVSTYKFKVVKLLLSFLIIIIVFTYILFSITHELPGYLQETVLKHAEYTLKMLLMVNHGHSVDRNMETLIVPLVFIFIGFMLHLLLLVLGMQIWVKFSSVDRKHKTIYHSTNAYMRYRALPMSLRNKICLYLDFKYQGHFYKESVIKFVTSPALRKEIILTITDESLKNVKIFKNCPGLVMNKIRAHMVSTIFLPGDVIIRAGSTGNCMFFILAGSVQVTTPEDKTICYLRDGAHFGEVALVISISRTANVIATTPCELFKLDRLSFWEVMKNYPQVWNQIKDEASQRIVTTSSSIVDDELRDSMLQSIHFQAKAREEMARPEASGRSQKTTKDRVRK